MRITDKSPRGKDWDKPIAETTAFAERQGAEAGFVIWSHMRADKSPRHVEVKFTVADLPMLNAIVDHLETADLLK